MITNEEVKRGLNEFKAIKPNTAFKKASKAIILSHEPERSVSFRLPLLRIGSVLAIIALVIFTLTLEFSPTPVLSSSFNPGSLEREFEGLTINVQIEEVKYQERASQTIASALNEIENSSVKHLNDSLIQNEAGSLEIQNATNPEIDALLETLIF